MKTKDEADQRPRLAFSVEIDCKSCIVFAATPAKARWIAVRSYWDAGYGRGPGTWPDAQARRIPRLDNSPLRLLEPKAYSPEYAEL